ncbi:MAG: Na+-transporting NADH:ubiquinone oxidoreductase, subunit NqrB, partial [Cyanobacteria bacterium]|nr:Na+-transporting NADH:ubiquinone oxidoreductase, subunit NqrB [Cyanobacteriota bacterium]
MLGLATRDWTLRPEVVAIAIATSLAVQLLCSLWLTHRFSLPFSPTPPLLS